MRRGPGKRPSIDCTAKPTIRNSRLLERIKNHTPTQVIVLKTKWKTKELSEESIGENLWEPGVRSGVPISGTNNKVHKSSSELK